MHLFVIWNCDFSWKIEYFRLHFYNLISFNSDTNIEFIKKRIIFIYIFTEEFFQNFEINIFLERIEDD